MPRGLLLAPPPRAVSGLGFGIMSSMVLFSPVLEAAGSPATLASRACPSLSLFFVMSWVALAVSLLHTFWMVIFFDAMDKRSIAKASFVLLGHALVAFLTLLIEGGHSCAGALVPMYALLATSMGMVFKVVYDKQTIAG
jgi:anterior pharynx defective protein 1